MEQNQPISIIFDENEKIILGPLINCQLVLKCNENEGQLIEIGSLLLTTTKFCFLFNVKSKEVGFYCRYYNCISHGTTDKTLFCLLSDISQPDDVMCIESESENQEKTSQSSENEESDSIVLFSALKEIIEGKNTMQYLEIKGDFQIRIDCSQSGESVENVFKGFTEGSSLNPDPPEYKSPFDQLDDFDNEFFTSDDIDEHGNIKPRNECEMEVEDESDELEENGENQEEIKMVEEENEEELQNKNA